MRSGLAARLLAATLTMLALCRGGAALADEDFTLTSTTFNDGELMPGKVADDRRGTCAGQNVSPQLGWTNAPQGTASFALIILDPQGQNGLGVYHFVGYGIAGDVTSFAEGELSEPTSKYVGGKNSREVYHYSGPCPPPGPPHHYSFVLIATDLATNALPPGLTVRGLLAELEGHAKGSTGMVGLFAEP